MSKKELPDFFTLQGKLFYYISKHRYVGISTKKLIKDFKMELLELIPHLISLYEKGLITILQVGKVVSDDIWDISTDLRKRDPDIQKIISSSNFLESALDKRLKELKELEQGKELKRMKDFYDIKDLKDFKKVDD